MRLRKVIVEGEENFIFPVKEFIDILMNDRRLLDVLTAQEKRIEAIEKK